MAQVFVSLLIVCLIHSAITKLPVNKLFVMPHEVSFFGTKDWLHYIDTEENYTYDQAEQTCLHLRLTSPMLYYLSIRSTLPPKGEFWIPFEKPMLALNGTHKLVSESDDLAKRRGIICQAPLNGALLVYKNSTLLHLKAENEFIPSYCYPQTDLNEEELDRLGLAMCLLIRRTVHNRWANRRNSEF